MLSPCVSQRVSTRSKSVERVGKRGLVNSSDAQIEIVGTTDVTGTKLLVPNEVGASVSRTLGGSQRRVTRGVTQEDGEGLAIDLGTLRPLASRVTPAQTEMVEHSASTRGNGRRNRFVSTATGTQGQKKVAWLEMRNTITYRGMKILLQQKKRRLLRNKS
jgi:hypothetical protein